MSEKDKPKLGVKKYMSPKHIKLLCLVCKHDKWKPDDPKKPFEPRVMGCDLGHVKLRVDRKPCKDYGVTSV